MTILLSDPHALAVDGFNMRPADKHELDVVVALYEHAQNWLAAKGLDQWQPGEGEAEERREKVLSNIARSIDDGCCHLVSVGAAFIATITLDERADPVFWREQDEPSSALYVHRMIVRRDIAGHGIGAALLDGASRLAWEGGKKWLRLDAWRSNGALHDYYKNQGFVHLRTECVPSSRSGALFQRESGPFRALPF
ncbi:GNAT family N-acetyltransferase [Nonomuraea sp. KM90]|uniref:GNAT family N-acetyltransferase n=1 Tax=Nonomuraea sp. KM90 TaxID=3457428 RepID=UPI003FCE0FF5